MEQIAARARSLAALPLSLRRRGLRALWHVGLLSGGSRAFGFADDVARLLRLGRREATRIDREIAFHDRLTSLEWASLLARDKAGLERDAAGIAIEGSDVLARAAASGKPIILAPLHMGNYVIALACLMKRFFAGRPMLILRARDDDADDTRVMQRIAEIGTELRFLKVSDKADYFEAVRFVRKGAVVIYFLDLPPSYGGAVDIALFGQPMRLALGVDALARLTDATVIPLSTTASLSGDAIHVGRPFEVVESGARERARVAAMIGAHIEASVLRAPEQWHFWPRLAEFASDRETLESAA